MAEAKKPNWFKRTWGKVCKYFRELKSELRKVALSTAQPLRRRMHRRLLS